MFCFFASAFTLNVSPSPNFDTMKMEDKKGSLFICSLFLFSSTRKREKPLPLSDINEPRLILPSGNKQRKIVRAL